MRSEIATAGPDHRTDDAVREGLATPGHVLDPPFRDRLQHGFGQQLGDVRLHTDRVAGESARQAGARAYTMGSDIIFGVGRYRPNDSDGWRLLSHEIAHVLQQRGAPRSDGPLPLATESSERAARGAADAIARGDLAPALGSTDGRVLARDALSIEDFDEPPSKAPPTTPADDEETDLTAAPVTPFSAQLSTLDPSVIFVPIDATRDVVGRQLKVDASRFYIVGSTEARPPKDDLQGIRFYDPLDIPTDLMKQIQGRLDAALPRDVDATVAALVAESGGWTATQYVLRWLQYSRYRDLAGITYLDRYFDALATRRITTTRDWLITTTSSSRSGLDELLAQTGGDVHAAVLRARSMSSRAEAGDASLNADAPLPLGHVVGRWVSGQDATTAPAQVATVLMTGIADREEAEIRFRNANFIGNKVMIASKDGLWYGYGIFFDTSLSGSLLPPVVGGAEEKGRFYWYYPSTVFVAHGETDPNAPPDKPQSRALQTQLLADALASTDVRALLSLDYGVLKLATTEQRVEIFRHIVGAGFANPQVRGYSVDNAAQTLARTVLTMSPKDFMEFERSLDQAGITATLLASKDARLAPLGAAFTFQTMAGTALDPASFSDPVELTHGTKDIKSGLDYYIATAQRPVSGEAGTTVTFEHGHSPTDWQDRPPWDRRSKQTTRAMHPTDLVSLETITPSGTHRQITSAFEAALTQGDPKSQVEHESFMDFLGVVMLIQGGAAALRLGGLGLRAFAAGNLRFAMRVLAEELATETGKREMRSLVDLALFSAAGYASAHQEELEKTPQGRAFLAMVTAATALLAARDIGALVESGAVERLILMGRDALTVVGDAARLAVRRTMQNFRAARLAWDALKRDGLVVATNVGGVTMLRPASPQALAVAFRMGQAQAAGEELMTALGTGATAERASATLGRLEGAAGKLQRPKGAPAHTESEVEAAKAYRDVARHLTKLADKERVAVLDALDRLMGNAKRPVVELAPFIRAALGKAGRANVIGYLDAVQWLSKSGISREGFARLGENAVGRNPADLEWLSTQKLSAKDLDDLALNEKTPWKTYREASMNPTDVKLLKRAQRGLRAQAAEVVAADEATAGRLSPGYRVTGKHVEVGGEGGSEIDLELTSTDGLGRKRLAEVKGFTRETWKRSLDAYARDPTAASLTDPMDVAGSSMIKKMLKQLADARAATPRGDLPILAVSEGIAKAQRTTLEALVAGKAEVVYIPEGAITTVSGRLARSLGIR
jgi:hypothetical protein